MTTETQKGLFPATKAPGRRTVIQEHTPEVEVVTSEPTAMTLYSGGGALATPEEAPPVAALAMLENALAITERMAQVVSSLRVAAIKMTDPVDWVLSRDKQKNELAMLTASGAQKVASLYGILLEPLAGETSLEPTRVQLNGKLAFNLKCRAHSRLLGRWIEIEATRREDEEFTGRETDEKGDLKFNGGHTFEPDLKKSVRTLAITSAVRELVGLKNVSRQELDASWQGTTKSTERCRFGHGYGTSGERTAAGVAEGDVPAKAEELRVELLRRVSGDEDAAKKLLGEITVDKDGKFAKTSTKQFTQAWQVEKAWERLRGHAVFGDKAQRREPGE